MLRVVSDEECNVWVVDSFSGNRTQISPEPLRMIKAHEARKRIVAVAETLQRKPISQLLDGGRGGRIEAREKVAPEHRQKAVGAEPRGQEEPIIFAARITPAQLVDRCNPTARQGACAPGFR